MISRYDDKKTTSYKYYNKDGEKIVGLNIRSLGLNRTPKSEDIAAEKYKLDHRILLETSLIRQDYSDYISLESRKNVITSQSVKVGKLESVDLSDSNINQSLLIEMQKAHTFNYNQINKTHDIIKQSMESTSKIGD